MDDATKTMSEQKSFLQRLNIELEEGWEAKLRSDGRIYYINHKTQTSSWLPPRENWQDSGNLPFGWETALDTNDKPYFINHMDKYTTREDPRLDPDYIEPPRPREVELVRDQEKGFGFVAGSEKPVVVRFVTEGGPSVDKLLPGDLILKINGEEVRRAPREKVIELVRSCKQSIVLTVCQPYSDNSSRKSAILTAAKKAKLKNNPSRVRFADAILVNGASVASSQQSPQESYMPFMPNVLKVFLENGQTKSFKYDNKTTVKDVVYSLQEKLSITCTHHFSLVLQDMKSNIPGKMTLLQEHETLAELAARPGARHFRCLFRVAFVPHDAYDLLKEDPIAFEYFYMQCCNDVIHERFASEMKYDTALRLAALQIQQHAVSNNMTGKISIKSIEKESGLDKFVAHSLLENMKSKDLRKMLVQYMKMNQSLAAPGQKQLTALQAKLHYLKIVSELKTFGSRVFMVTLLDQKSEAMILVGPKSGVSVVTNIKSYTLTQIADFYQIENVKVTKDGENMCRVDISMKANNRLENIGLGLLMEDAQNFVSMLVGYYHIFVDRERRIVEKIVGKNMSDPNVPSYEAQHRVLPSPWAYPEDLVSEIFEPDQGQGVMDDERIIDLSQSPPSYEKDEKQLAIIKQELGIKADVLIEVPPAGMDASDLPETLASPSRMTNGQSFEEGVTSFGRTASTGNTSISLNESISLQKQTLKNAARLSNEFLNTDSVTVHATKHTSQDPQSNQTLVTFRTSPQDHQNPTSGKEASSQHNTREAAVITWMHLDAADLSQTLPSFGVDSLDLEQNDQSLSENTDSTSSLLTNETSERQALLSDRQSKNGESPNRFSALNMDNIAGAKTNDGLDAESDDTDSMGTPRGSPAKGRQLKRNSSIDLGLQSFGLHSPDTLPAADADFQNLEENVQITSNGTVEAFNTVYSSQGAMGQRLYYDPDIIDLTNFPPPETPDDDSVLDFTESNFPPPIFSSNSSLASWSKNEPDSVCTIPLPARSMPGRLERSASIGNCPDFLDNDIDALIAQFVIPPPPSSSDSSLSSHTNLFSHIKPAGDNSSQVVSTDISKDKIDEELAMLIIPPPPTNSSSSAPLDNIPVVPPVPSSLISQKRVDKSIPRHKRSSSLDISLIRSSENQLDSKSRSISVDDNKNAAATSKTIQSSYLTENISTDSPDDLTGNSPASVSQKLHNLLQSLPNFSKGVAQISDVHDSEVKNSHRVKNRSSSVDLTTFTKPSTSLMCQSIPGNKPSSSIPVFSRSSSLRLNGYPGRSRSQSHEPVTTISFRKTEAPIPTASFAKTDSTKDLDTIQSSNGSESFASMKAKLRDYRDLLLSRSKSSASKKYIVGANSNEVSDTGKSSQSRSGSFSKLLAQFSRRSSKSDEQITLASSDANWELKEAKPAVTSQQPYTEDQNSENGGEKRVPVVRDALGLNRPTLRPVSNALSHPCQGSPKNETKNETSDDNKGNEEETKARKNGPVKALQPIHSVDGSRNTVTLPRFTAQDSGWASNYYHQQQQRQQQPQQSKDDILMVQSYAREKVKANPYATIKMWRPTSTASSSMIGGQGDDVYRSFTPFTSQGQDQSSPSTKNWSSRNGSWQKGYSDINGYDELPADYSRDSSPAPLFKRADQRDETNDPAMDYESDHSSTPSTKSQNSPGSATPSSSSTPAAQPQPPPVPAEKEPKGDASYQVVSDGTANSVKLVLSHTYTDTDLVGKDVERLLTELKLTMDCLKASTINKNPSQLSTCLSELQSHTKQFIQEAKLMVSSANGSHEKITAQLESAVHALAHVFLHGQATMLLMPSLDHAQHLGFQLIKAANSFKSTVSAACLAEGKSLDDPNMRYLMRQAQNLAALLASLVNTIKEVQPD